MPLPNFSFFKKQGGSGKLIDHEVIEQDFVPYACHYNPNTILTKNGELLQVIRITGFAFEALTNDIRDLRQTIREAIRQSVQSTDFAISIHTVRRAANIQPQGEYPEDFSRILNAAWVEHNHWDNQYLNEIFITILHQGEQASITNPGTLLRGLFPMAEIKARDAYLEQAHAALDETVLNIMRVMNEYGAHRLGLIEDNGVIYSEPLKFLDKLVTLTDEDVPLQEKGLDDVLAQHVDVAFGNNVMEVRNYKARKTRYGALLTLKEYHEISLNALGRLLQMPIEFVITQSFDFINANKALECFEHQAEIYEMSGARELAQASGITSIMTSNRGEVTDFGEHQITIFIMADTVELVEKHLRLCLREFSNIGMSLLREDLMLEEGYWAQLPGNFPFLKRLRPTNTARIGGFALLNNLPSGRANNTHWGPALTLFYTAAATPYFFNFHIGSNGHTMLIGPRGAGKTVLMNFLLSEARKVQPKMFYFDYDRASEIFIRSLNGDYHRLHELDHMSQPLSPAMNPLQLPDTPGNRTFLIVWLECLLQDAAPGIERYREQFWPHLAAAVEHIYTLPREERRLATLADFARLREERIGIYLAEWHSTGRYASLFDHATDALDLSNPVIGFNLTEVMRDKRMKAPVVAYLLHRVMNELDGYPAIVVLDEAWQLLDNPLFASRLGGWLEKLRASNAIALLATEQVEEIDKSDLNPTIMEHIATQIYLANPSADAAYMETFGLTQQEVVYVTAMEARRRHFLLKRGRESIVAELNLKGLEPLLNVLSADEDRLRKYEQIIATHGTELHEWLPRYLDAA
jgi:type IV secretion system protein VirB4